MILDCAVYEHGERRSGELALSEASAACGREGAFVACTFWAAQVLAEQGRRAEAEALFARALSTRNDLGLFAEEHDPRLDTALGNFPQALTHLSHIDAALALAAGQPRRAAGVGARQAIAARVPGPSPAL